MAAATATAAAAASVTAAAAVAVARAARSCRSEPLGTGVGLTLLRHLSQPIRKARTRRPQSLPLLHHSSHSKPYCCRAACALARSEQRAGMATAAAQGGPATAAAAAGAAAAGSRNPLHSSRGSAAQQRPTAAVAAAAAAAADGEGGSVSVVAEISNEASGKASDGATNGAPAAAAAAAIVADATAETEDFPREIFLTDYSPPNYTFDTVHLSFDLHEDYTQVDSTITVKPASENAGPLVLDGSNLELLSVKVDGSDLLADTYTVMKRHLTLLSPPQSPFSLSISTRIDPKNNTSLEGLYKSTSNFCTQCEAEGFRKITYFLDRPDVMAKYTTRIEADEDAYPVLLSNGNLVDQGKAQTAGRHYALWEDPWPKPSYLFALVAGRLACVEDTFTTASGRNVTLRIFVQPGDESRTEHAMRSLIASMKWDEQVFGLEYDLDLFNIVAVPDFNMGAMENKSLNIFNSRLVLASPETATDGDYTAIESVVAHEYFHNWTGNRVTCRDWFQLTLKEGLTVYRDQEFSADMNDRAVERINDVVRLRSSQFAQDAGPMAHPVRPLSYIKMDNFYTVTVYEKGAEVVRMYETLLGKDGFRKGMDLYFARHDGCAVTCDDFFAAMRDANSAKLTNFPFWLSQAGTPLVTVTSAYDDKAHTLTLHCRQELPSTPGQPGEAKHPMLIPLRVGLVSRRSGDDVRLSAVFDGTALRDVSGDNGTTVLHFDKAEQSFTFTDVEEEVVPSLLRGFSAPVRLRSDLTTADLLFLLANDSDAFNRWEACQTVARELMLAMVAAQQRGEELSLNPTFVEAIRAVVTNRALDKAFIARVLSLPGESEIAELMSPADPDAIHAVSKFCRNEIARQLRPELERIVEENKAPEGEAYSPDHHSKARRALKNTALLYLASLHDDATVAAAKAAYDAAANMTDQFVALAALSLHDSPERSDALERFYQQWKHDGLVMNKWLSLQASSAIPGNVEKVRSLKSHPAFVITEPNKVYSLMGGFTACPVNFHAADGSGYEFIADSVIELDKINPQVAARIVSAFTRWRNYDQPRQEKAKAQLERIAATTGLSENVFEIVSKSLGAPPPS